MSKYVTWDNIDEGDGGEAAHGKKRRAASPIAAALAHARDVDGSPVERVFVRDCEEGLVYAYAVRHEVTVEYEATR